MSPIAWLWGSDTRAHSWGEQCPAGTPVPSDDRCLGPDCDSVRLTALVEGARGRVTCLEDPAGAAATKLAAMGVVPGAAVELLQRFPAFVFRIGYAEIAVDEALAELIRVRRE
jgi:DtxR family Mn-dependent transcriptional regulator